MVEGGSKTANLSPTITIRLAEKKRIIFIETGIDSATL
jgi:hypothetical protein|tara:strand:+ start:53 stop:166 length:114 start_codon:yes stop_codon:yes gene_type:complete